MPRINRGVLRQEVCRTLKLIYGAIRGSNPRRVKEWQDFSAVSVQESKFRETYEQLVAVLVKWSSKSKHNMFCLDALVPLLAYASESFWNSLSLSILQAVVKRAESEGDRLAGLTLTELFFNSTPRAYINGMF